MRGWRIRIPMHMLGLEKLDRQTARLADKPTPWYFSPRQLALRLFLTCWIVYSLHFASNTVREIYLALAIGDHLSFRVRSEEHTSELQSHSFISYAVFCLINNK